MWRPSQFPKTKRSRRTIDLDQRTVSVLERHRATQREELFELGITLPTDDRVFPNEVGGYDSTERRRPSVRPPRRDGVSGHKRGEAPRILPPNAGWMTVADAATVTPVPDWWTTRSWPSTLPS
jgi:hypothetical protein